jgi:hypothetical protein
LRPSARNRGGGGLRSWIIGTLGRVTLAAGAARLTHRGRPPARGSVRGHQLGCHLS